MFSSFISRVKACAKSSGAFEGFGPRFKARNSADDQLIGETLTELRSYHRNCAGNLADEEMQIERHFECASLALHRLSFSSQRDARLGRENDRARIQGAELAIKNQAVRFYDKVTRSQVAKLLKQLREERRSHSDSLERE